MVDLTKQPIGSSLCTLGPWGDRLVEILTDIVKRYPDVKAFSFDGLHHYDTCYCQFCRKAYRDATGKEIPDRNMEDPEFRRYVHFMDRRMED